MAKYDIQLRMWLFLEVCGGRGAQRTDAAFREHVPFLRSETTPVIRSSAKHDPAVNKHGRTGIEIPNRSHRALVLESARKKGGGQGSNTAAIGRITRC
jgi:hypothetical protein